LIKKKAGRMVSYIRIDLEKAPSYLLFYEIREGFSSAKIEIILFPDYLE
jgi:hypothetical protein